MGTAEIGDGEGGVGGIAGRKNKPDRIPTTPLKSKTQNARANLHAKLKQANPLIKPPPYPHPNAIQNINQKCHLTNYIVQEQNYLLAVERVLLLLENLGLG